MSEVKCKKCREICAVEGDYPKFHAWCDTCKDYAKGFDVFEYAADVMGSRIDEAMSFEEILEQE